MAEKEATRIVTEIDLMRGIYSKFDENTLVIGGTDVTLTSGGIPIEVLEERGRLVASVTLTPTLTVSTLSSDWLEQQNAQLGTENFLLRQRIRAVEERLAKIEASLPKERVLILREISREEAREEIRNLFSTGRTLYYSDIAEELRLDLEMVVEICNELKESEEISIDASVS